MRTVRAETWRTQARCIGHGEVMFDNTRTDEALARCASCPVSAQCLQSTLASEDGEPYRYGVAGGYGPLDRERMAAGERPTQHRKPAQPTTEFRRQRKCRGCDKRFKQPKAGRPRLWCSPVCQWRTTKDRAADAGRARRTWDDLDEAGREARREKMRERWASLTPEARAEIAARRRRRRAAAHEAGMVQAPARRAVGE